MKVGDVKPEAIAACIALASKISGSLTVFGEPTNEVYWHTRELAFVTARASGIMWSQIMYTLKRFDFQDEPSLRQSAGSLWPYLAHPDVIAREVMES